MVLVEDDGCAKAAGRVYARSGDGDGCQVNQEHRESNGEGSQDLCNRHIRFISQVEISLPIQQICKETNAVSRIALNSYN